VSARRAATGDAVRLGIDIGGTFTDATLIHEATGEIKIAKVLSTPRDPSDGFARSAERILAEADVAGDAVEYIVHATTVATNAIIEGKAARTALITTEGFRDILEIAKSTRPSLYDLRFVKPRPLIPRHLCFTVRERLDAHGGVLTPLDDEDVRQVAAQIGSENVEAIAICLLHSYLNPQHELEVERILREELPEAIISSSAKVCPEFREYFRASTTAINASIRPIVSRYLEKIEARLGDTRVDSELLVMQSSGGVYRADSARENPVYMVESGPAAGVIAATFIGGSLGYDDVLSFDMGGTTAKVGLVLGGRPRVTKDYEVGATAHATTGEGRGSGYPIRTPVIDLVEIGAGGGSIAWVDSGGVLRVGPESAGADPGPACYGHGGMRPTVTDANLVLGRLNPKYFLGGEIELDLDAAVEAIERECAAPLGLSTVRAALSIIEIANASMVNAIRLVSVQRGYDPRSFALIAFGGAGPAHANRLAAENDIATTIIPPSPGITSAMGLLATDLKHEYSATFLRLLEEVSARELEQAFRSMERKGRAELVRESLPRDAMQFLRSVDVRYVGQSYELTMSLRGERVGREAIKELVSGFHDEHERAYGFKAPGEAIEVVAARVTAVGLIDKPRLRTVSSAGAGARSVQERRPVYFEELGDFADCPVHNRYALEAGSTVVGPAIVEEVDSTTVIHPGYQGRTTDVGFLVITQVGPGRSRPARGTPRRRATRDRKRH
jgi:N-methylhydantoinase A